MNEIKDINAQVAREVRNRLRKGYKAEVIVMPQGTILDPQQRPENSTDIDFIKAALPDLARKLVPIYPTIPEAVENSVQAISHVQERRPQMHYASSEYSVYQDAIDAVREEGGVDTINFYNANHLARVLVQRKAEGL